MQIQIDSREKSRAIKKILECFDNHSVSYYVSKLYVGDYMSLDNPRLIIDRKQNLGELCQNVCQGHERFVKELKKAKEAGIQLVILCEHGGRIKSMEDVEKWVNPRLKTSPMAVSGERLHRILRKLNLKYDVRYEFCKKSDTGKRIIELLGGDVSASS